MLRAAKRAAFYTMRAFGLSVVKNARGGYSLVPNAVFDRSRKEDVLRWVEEKIAETSEWAALEEERILAKWRDTEEWVALETAKIEAKRREAEAWVGIEENRIAERRREADAWVGTEENRLAEQRREAESWVGTEENRIAKQRREADAWVRAEEDRIAERRREADAWVGTEENRLAEQRREAESWVGTEENRLAEQRREAESWVGTEENRIAKQRREADAWVGAEEDRIAERRREADAWVGTEENRLAEQRREAESWVGTEENRLAEQRREAESWVGTEENRIAERRREAETWVGTEESRIAELRGEAAAWVGDGEAGAAPADRPPEQSGDALPDGMPPQRIHTPRLAEFSAVVDSIKPWAGHVPNGFFVDALGVLTRSYFRPGLIEDSGERDVTTRLPTVAGDGEGWFEMVDWLVSAREAEDDYVAVSLGAAYGAQLVGAWKALQLVNPLPSLLVAVEAVPENCEWIAQHMRDNGIAPEDHVIIQAAVGRDNEVVLFPVGAPGSGRNNCVSTNALQSRAIYAQVLGRPEHAPRIVRNLFKTNSTGLARDLGDGAVGEVKFVSAVTLGDVLGPLRRVDFLEVDIPQSEIDVIPPFIGLLTRKVRRIHIGTHGASIHAQLRALFVRAGWQIVFDYAPDAQHDTELGAFPTSDGILTARNPKV